MVFFFFFTLLFPWHNLSYWLVICLEDSYIIVFRLVSTALGLVLDKNLASLECKHCHAYSLFFPLLYLSFVIVIIKCYISCSLADNFLSRIQSTRTYSLSEYIFLSSFSFCLPLPHHCLHEHHLRLPLKRETSENSSE